MSESKKIIHELDVEDLVKLAESAEEPVIQEKLSDAGKFIFDLKIKHGDKKISAELIFHTYKEWKGLEKRNWQARTHFFRDFKKYFTPVRGRNGVAYLLDPAPFDLSREHYFFVRSEQRREQRIKNKTKAQKSG